MKKVILINIAIFLLTWLSIINLSSFIDELRGRDTGLIETMLITLLWITGPFVVMFLDMRSVLPRLKYLENEKNEKPTFKSGCSSVIDVPEDFEYSRLKTEIAEKWLITFSDDVEHVLKFRDKWKFSKGWRAAAWAKYCNHTRKFHLECFPMYSQNLDVATEMQKEIESCVELNDLFALTLARYDNSAPL